MLLFCILLAGFALVLWQTAALSYDFFLRQTQAQSRQALNLYGQNLRRSLERHEFLPLLYASHQSIAGLLADPRDRDLLATSNALLERVNRLTGSSDTFLLDTGGRALAASDWDQPDSHIGGDFAAEPYFKAAMQGRLGRYYAIGDGSDERGYYFASPVRREGAIRGVVVTIVGVEAIEDSWWTTGRNELFVTDDHGVIFISSRQGWRYRVLPAPASEPPASPPFATRETAEAVRSARYNRTALTPFNLVYGDSLEPGARVVRVAPFDDSAAEAEIARPLPEARMVEVAPARVEPSGTSAAGAVSGIRDRKSESFLLQKLEMRELGWTLYILADITAIPRQTATVTILAGLLLLAIALGGGFWHQRRRHLAQRAELQQQSRQALEAAYGQLEHRVHERTRDLLTTNRKLLNEIQERRRTEQELRQTQSELVQAEKLAALGHISAGISHELNQPLTAIRSFSDNAIKLLERDRLDDVRSNLGLISELTGRIAQLMKQLRTFARSAPGRRNVVSLPAILDKTLAVLRPRIEALDVELDIAAGLQADSGADVLVIADELRLEQVLGNVLGNALDALEKTPLKRISIDIGLQGDEAVMTVRDSGPGIPPDCINEIFDPFFTTKEVGQGLGLGLSITYGIVKDFGGSIRASNHPEGGAVFSLALPRHHEAAGLEREAV